MKLYLEPGPGRLLEAGVEHGQVGQQQPGAGPCAEAQLEAGVGVEQRRRGDIDVEPNQVHGEAELQPRQPVTGQSEVSTGVT